MSQPCAEYDLFLSYRWADADAVAPLLAELQRRNIRVWRDKSEVEDLASIQHAVSSGLARSRAVLAWYSARYNNSRSCQWELTRAYIAAEAASDSRQRILVLNPEPTNAHILLPKLSDQLQIDATESSGDTAAIATLADRVQTALTRVPTTPLGSNGPSTPPRWLPATGTGSTRFVGRLAEMWNLHRVLQAGNAPLLRSESGKSGWALVQGAGGAGKSLMVEEYALRFGGSYSGGVFWLRALGNLNNGRSLDSGERRKRQREQLIGIAQGLGMETGRMNDVQLKAALRSHFSAQGLPFLWVVDDLPSDSGIEGLKDWEAPHSLGHTLYTTRGRRIQTENAIELPQLEPSDARGLLIRGRTLTSEEEATADTICGLLGHHALAIDVTAALVGRHGLSKTLANLQHPDRDALTLAARLDEELPNGHVREVAATFLTSIAQVDQPTRELLHFASELAVAPIPTELLVAAQKLAAGMSPEILGSEQFSQQLLAAMEPHFGWTAAGPKLSLRLANLQDDFVVGCERLIANSLADHAGEGWIKVHALVSRTVRFADEASTGERLARRKHLIDALLEVMPQVADILTHARWSPWVVHARELTATANDMAAANLLGWVSRFDLERGASRSAEDGYERVLKAHVHILGHENDPSTLNATANLAEALRAQGDLGRAERLLRHVLVKQRRMLGEEHPDTLASTLALSGVLTAQGDAAGGGRMQQELLYTCERVLGAEHAITLHVMDGLGLTLHSQRDFGGAKQLQQEVLSVRKQKLGGTHPDTLLAMNNLAATLLADKSDLAGASRLFGEVLATCSRLFADDHPLTLAAMTGLSATLWRQGKVSAARDLMCKVTALRLNKFGEKHPDTISAIAALFTMRGAGEKPDSPSTGKERSRMDRPGPQLRKRDRGSKRKKRAKSPQFVQPPPPPQSAVGVSDRERSSWIARLLRALFGR